MMSIWKFDESLRIAPFLVPISTWEQSSFESFWSVFFYFHLINDVRADNVGLFEDINFSSNSENACFQSFSIYIIRSSSIN